RDKLVTGVQTCALPISSHSRLLVPSGYHHFPSWMAGPFRGDGDGVRIPELNRLLIEMAALYLLVLACARSLPAWVAIAGVVALKIGRASCRERVGEGGG